MSSSLLQSLEDWIPASVAADAAGVLEESESAVAKGLHNSYSSILAALAAHSHDPRFTRQIFDLANQAEDEMEFLADVSRALGGSWTDLRLIELGPELLAKAFGARADSVADAVARHAGLRGTSARSLLTFAAPLVLGFLGRRMRETGMDAAAFAGLLQTERHHLTAAVPAGVATLLGLAAPTPVGLHAGHAVAEPSGRKIWPWALAAAAVLALVLWPFLRGVPDPIGDVAGEIEQTTEQAAAAVSDALDLGPTSSRDLASGAAIMVPERGVEHEFIDHIESADPIDINRWFALDRVYFETGSAVLNADAESLMDNLAGILMAYPAVHVEIGGFADATGDHEANQALSQNRADAVRSALIARGIDGARVTATAYGDDHPLASNVTTAGREQNRSALARVTQK